MDEVMAILISHYIEYVYGENSSPRAYFYRRCKIILMYI